MRPLANVINHIYLLSFGLFLNAVNRRQFIVEGRVVAQDAKITKLLSGPACCCAHNPILRAV